MRTMQRLFPLVIGAMLLAPDGRCATVKSGGLDIHYRVFGQGAPLLVVGGGPGDNANRYLSLCELLSGDYRCILVDQRGTGASMPAVLDSSTISVALTLDDFESVRKALGIDEWAVLGFSYGGFLSSLYAHFFPSAVSRLILLDSIGLNRDVFGYFSDNIFSGLTPEDRGLVDYWTNPARMDANPHHAIVERIRAMMPGYFYDRSASLAVSQAIEDGDFNFEMGQLLWRDVRARKLDLATTPCGFHKPVLILHGRQDPVGESIPQILSRYYPTSELVFVEKAGHYSWIEQPDKVLSSVRAFLPPED